MTTLQPHALADSPALIETVFPAQKVSVESQRERKAVSAQTLTGLGSYWKGRKPLILVRAIVLGSLLPATDDPAADLAVFEKLMAFDDESLARRALADTKIKRKDIEERITIFDPDHYFSGRGWRRGLSDDDKLPLYRQVLATYATYTERAELGKRPEEVDQQWLYEPVWDAVNRHYAHLGIDAHSTPELVEQLGILRYGRRPRVGDTFCGGGSIPFEAARLGCDAYASDLNPVACMLTWGAFNVIGATERNREALDQEQERVFAAVENELTELGVETNETGERAKAYLYCLEARCPQTGWMVPLAPSWLISPKQRAIARLVPDPIRKRFAIEIVSGASPAEIAAASHGTIQGGDMVYTLDGAIYRTPIKTLRGDYRQTDGTTGNRLRKWGIHDFAPQSNDIFQERLYAIQWITAETVHEKRQDTYFAAPTSADLKCEAEVNAILTENLAQWQIDGLVPNMTIEPGYNTDQPIRERGWTHWHHLFNPRQLLLLATLVKHWRASTAAPLGWLNIAKAADFDSRLCRWLQYQGGGLGGPTSTYYNQALNTLYNYATRTWIGFGPSSFRAAESKLPITTSVVCTQPAGDLTQSCDLWITDPPYADAVMYDEITEFFIAWLRKDPPEPFASWVWDSRRALAIKGDGDGFRNGMVGAYRAMAEHMSDNGMQCVMFTHQDTSVWGDLIGIFWAAGLQVVSAWYTATEKVDGIKKGAFVQGTVILILKKRTVGERAGFKQRLLPEVRHEVEQQIASMMHLSDTAEQQHGEPVFTDADLQMAGYAAALKVLTGYTKIGGEDVTSLALRPRAKGETTVVDEIVQQAAETASNLLVPEGMTPDLWSKLAGIERFYCRMLDIESSGVFKLDNYQNFAKAFRVDDYTQIMASLRPNDARMKTVTQFTVRDLGSSTELGSSRVGQLLIALQQVLSEVEPQAAINQLHAEMPDFLDARPLLANLLAYMEKKAESLDVRNAADVLGSRLRNLRLGGSIGD